MRATVAGDLVSSCPDPQVRREIEEMWRGVAEEIAELEAQKAAARAARHKAALDAREAPAKRRRKVRAELRNAREAARRVVAAALASLGPPLRDRPGRPSLIDDPERRALFEVANTAGCSAEEIGDLFGVKERTVRRWRAQL